MPPRETGETDDGPDAGSAGGTVYNPLLRQEDGHAFRDKALTLDDVLLVPAYSAVLPRETDLSTRLTRRIPLKLPLVSAAMDTVTERAPGHCAGAGGRIGIIHKNLSPSQQAAEVLKVKRSRPAYCATRSRYRPRCASAR